MDKYAIECIFRERVDRSCLGLYDTKNGRRKSKKTITLRYGMTNVSKAMENAKQILQWRQNHWRIENRSHHRRDVTLGEDACQVRTNKAPEVLAALNERILA